MGDVVIFMSPFNEIFNEILKEITPTQKEVAIIKDITERLQELLDRKAKELKIDYTKKQNDLISDEIKRIDKLIKEVKSQ